MAAISTKSQSLKKWTLLCFSLVAGAIWIRNLFILLPQSGSEIVSVADSVSKSQLVVKSPVRPSAFDDSSKWTDPFAPPEPKRSPVTQGVAERKSPPKPPLEPPPWKLAGVVWDKKSPAAILASLTDNRRVVVAKGDTLGSARIERIEQEKIWIRHDGKTWTLALETEGSSVPR